MVVLSARFAVLACLCAALPLVHPPSVEAAHLHGSHSSSHSHHRAPSASPTRTHSYGGKHQGNEPPHHRTQELPPLLRRHTFQDYRKAENYHGQGHHDQAHSKISHSAFARSRYRGVSGPHSRRSSIYVPGEHGDTYFVTPSRNQGNARTGTGRRLFHTYNRRQLDESNLALGRIDIMGAAPPASSTQRLASLMVDSTPIDWTSGQSSTKAFTLNASMTNQTQFIMMPMDELSNTASAGSFSKYVTLATEVFDASSAEMVMYCATYDPDPGSTSALLMTPCTGQTQSPAPANDAADPCSYAANDASSSNPHQSQIFSYDPSTGRIEPISATTISSNFADNSDDPMGCAGARVRRDDSNSTTRSSTTASSTSTHTTPTPTTSQQARNVTLVYVAGALEVPASSPSASTTIVNGGQTPLFTTTITTTVVTTVTPGPANRTATLAQAAVSIPVSSTPGATASQPSSSLSPSSSTSTMATSKVPATAGESLEVEIVGVTPSLSASSLSTSSSGATTTATTTTATTTTSSYSSVSPSLDAQAVASSLANAMVHPRRRTFVSASASATPL